MGFPSCKALHDIIYRQTDRQTYVTDFVEVGIKLLNTERTETNNDDAEYLVEHSGLFFRKVAYRKSLISSTVCYLPYPFHLLHLITL
jgi:hypothetical protein